MNWLLEKLKISKNVRTTLLKCANFKNPTDKIVEDPKISENVQKKFLKKGVVSKNVLTNFLKNGQFRKMHKQIF